MFDFRYHALSLVAVFLALAIGILLGATIGEPVVSAAQEDLNRQLQQDLQDLSADRRDARAELDGRDRLVQEAFPMIAEGRLAGQRVAVVASGPLPGEVERSVRDAVEAAGGEVVSTTELDLPADAVRVGNAAGGQYADLEPADPRLATLLRLTGESIVRGRGLAERLQGSLPDRFRGELEATDAVVLYREPPAEGRDTGVRAGLEDELVDGLRAGGGPVVGVEQSETDPSQVPFFEHVGVSSVDSVDLVGGRLGLVLALDGGEGTFGFKGTAERALPEVPPAGTGG